MSVKVEKVSRSAFVRALDTRDPSHDKFAMTFRAKADALELWPFMKGVVLDGQVAAAIIVKWSKRYPTVANLHLLHTFARFRRRGLARELTVSEFTSFANANPEGYFRVSAEPEAVPFYRSLGFRFWGRQKSGSYLSIFKVDPARERAIANGIYDREDRTILKALGDGSNPRKGQLVEIFEELQ